MPSFDPGLSYIGRGAVKPTKESYENQNPLTQPIDERIEKIRSFAVDTLLPTNFYISLPPMIGDRLLSIDKWIVELARKVFPEKKITQEEAEKLIRQKIPPPPQRTPPKTPDEQFTKLVSDTIQFIKNIANEYRYESPENLQKLKNALNQLEKDFRSIVMSKKTNVEKIQDITKKLTEFKAQHPIKTEHQYLREKIEHLDHNSDAYKNLESLLKEYEKNNNPINMIKFYKLKKFHQAFLSFVAKLENTEFSKLKTDFILLKDMVIIDPLKAKVNTLMDSQLRAELLKLIDQKNKILQEPNYQENYPNIQKFESTLNQLLIKNDEKPVREIKAKPTSREVAAARENMRQYKNEWDDLKSDLKETLKRKE
jgi:hypothetical protein